MTDYPVRKCFYDKNVFMINAKCFEPPATHGTGTTEGYRVTTSSGRRNSGCRHSASTAAAMNDDTSLKSLTRDESDVVDSNGPR